MTSKGVEKLSKNLFGHHARRRAKEFGKKTPKKLLLNDMGDLQQIQELIYRENMAPEQTKSPSISSCNKTPNKKAKEEVSPLDAPKTNNPRGSCNDDVLSSSKLSSRIVGGIFIL